MRLTHFLLLTLILLATPAMAQNLFVKKKQPVVPTPLQTQQAPTDMKQFANQYYKNCLTKENPVLQKDSHKLFCACTSAKISETLTMEDMKILMETTPEGQEQRDRITLLVYVPCMEHPAHDLIYSNCVNDPGVKKSFRRAPKVCGCLADGMTAYWLKNGEKIVMAEGLKQGASLDPLVRFFNSPAYQEQSQYFTKTCVYKHEYGW